MAKLPLSLGNFITNHCKLNLFLNEIDIVDKINLMNKPSLMSDHKSDFLLEWNKLITE